MDLEKQPLELKCPACAKKFKKPLGRLKADPTIKCPGCGELVKIKAQRLRSALASVERSRAALKRAIDGFNKRK